MQKRNKLIGGVLAFAILATTLFVGVTVSQSKLSGNIERRAFDELKSNAAFYEAYISKEINELYIPLETLVDSFVITEDFDITKEREKIDAVVLNQQYTMISYADINGKAMNYLGEQRGNIADTEIYRKVFRIPKGENAIMYMETSEWTEEPRVVIAVPVRSGSNAVGMLLAGLELSVMNNLIVDGIGDNNPIVFVADSSGNVIMCNKSANEHLLGKNFFESHISEKAIDQKTANAIRANLQNGISGAFSVTHDELEYAAYVPLGVEDWCVFAVTHASTAAAKYSKNIEQFRSTTNSLTIAYVVSTFIVCCLGAYIIIGDSKARKKDAATKAHYDAILNMVGQTQFDYSYSDRRLITYGNLLDKLGVLPPVNIKLDSTFLSKQYPEADYAALIDKITQVKYAREPGTITLKVNDKNGQPHWIQVTLIPQYDEKGISNLCGVVLDVTAREKELCFHNELSETKSLLQDVPMHADMRTNISDDSESMQTDSADRPVVFAKTFGHFDIFVDEKPIHFSSKKGKELLAVLIDRQGGTLTSEEAIGILWENEPAGELQLTRYRKLLARLKQTLDEVGIGDILVSTRGVRSIDTSKVICDCWEAMNGNDYYIKAFQGVYMLNYSWSEEKAVSLESKLGHQQQFKNID